MPKHSGVLVYAVIGQLGSVGADTPTKHEDRAFEIHAQKRGSPLPATRRDFPILPWKWKHGISGILAEMIKITDDITPALAYDLNSPTPNRVCLQLGTKSQLKIEEIQPNPFFDHFDVRFSLPAASEIVFKINDANGRLLWSDRAKFEAGENRYFIDIQENTTNGVLYLTLESP